jgi:hypothetical protein
MSLPRLPVTGGPDLLPGSDTVTPDEFVSQIRKSVIEENLSLYKDLFASTDVKEARDPHWVRVSGLYSSLNNDDRRVLLDLIRQVMVDTISNVFAILDGVSQLEGQQGEFRLSASSQAEELNGELQDRLLELEERAKQS